MPDEIYDVDGRPVTTSSDQPTTTAVDTSVEATAVEDVQVRRLLEQLLLEQLRTNQLLSRLLESLGTEGVDGSDPETTLT